MPRPNFFELLNLEFDPTNNEELSKLEDIIKSWKETLEKRRGAGANPQVEQELKYESELKAVMLDKEKRKKEAMALKTERSEQLRQILDLLSCDEKEEQLVTKAQVRESGKKLGLSMSTAEKIFKEKHFTVQTLKATEISDYFLPDEIMNDINNSLEMIRKCTDNRYAWLSKIQDLYALCCFMDGQGEQRICDYQKVSAHKLYAIVHKWGVDNSTDQSDVGIKLNQLAAKAETQAFKTEQHMAKYNNSLKLETMKSFLEILKKSPKAFLHDPQFAEKCIDKISRLFGNYDLALSLYNTKAGLMLDPYEPFLPMVHVTCPSCRTISQFRSKKEAESARCSAC